MKTHKIENNYRMAGKKMTSRFGISHSQERRAAKAGFIPDFKTAKEEARRCSEYSSKKIRQMERWGNRRWKEFNRYEWLSHVCPNS